MKEYIVGGYTETGKFKSIKSFPCWDMANKFKQTHLWVGTGLSKLNPKVRV